MFNIGDKVRWYDVAICDFTESEIELVEEFNPLF